MKVIVNDIAAILNILFLSHHSGIRPFFINPCKAILEQFDTDVHAANEHYCKQGTRTDWSHGVEARPFGKIQAPSRHASQIRQIPGLVLVR